MKSKNYYGIGNDEYNYWKTTDNGKTWNYWKKGGGKAIIEDDYIITDKEQNFKGSEGPEEPETGPETGISYTEFSKDNGGSWEDFVEGEIVDGSPIDEQSFFNKDDKVIDENGKEIGPGPAKKAYKDGEETIIQGDNTRITIDKDGNKHFDIINFNIDDLLLYTLNDVIIPKLTFALLEKKGLEDIRYDPVSGMNTYYTNAQMYLVNPDMIDYLMDVGMRPLVIEDLPEYKENKALEKELADRLVDSEVEENNISEELLTNKTLARTFQIINILIDIMKNYYLKKELTKITNLKEDYEGLRQEDIPLMKMYYDLAKGSKESIIGTIINSIFTFNNSKKMALLKTSIVKTVYNVKERIKIRIELLKEKIKFTSKEELLNNEYFKKILRVNLKEEWNTALKESLIEYYKTAKKNILSMTNNNDKDLISLASDKYKEYRSEFLYLASEELENIKGDEDDKRIEALNTSLNKALDKFSNNVNKIITEEDVENKLYKALDEYKKEEQEVLKESDVIFSNMLHSAAGKFKNSLIDINVDNYSFDEDDYAESLDDLDFSSRKRVYDYYNDIIGKFKERCCELYILVGDKVIDSYINPALSISGDLNIWINNLLLNKNYEEYINNNSLKFLSNNGIKSCDDFYKLTKQEWNNSKEMI